MTNDPQAICFICFHELVYVAMLPLDRATDDAVQAQLDEHGYSLGAMERFTVQLCDDAAATKPIARLDVVADAHRVCRKHRSALTALESRGWLTSDAYPLTYGGVTKYDEAA